MCTIAQILFTRDMSKALLLLESYHKI